MDAILTHDPDAAWPFAHGEMAQRVREHEWSATALGPARQWPASLKRRHEVVHVSRKSLGSADFVFCHSERWDVMQERRLALRRQHDLPPNGNRLTNSRAPRVSA
jgi:hypothetical protein